MEHLNWTSYREAFLSGRLKVEESHFILGVDLGNSTSAVAYFDTNHNAPEIIDMSGGYGKPSVPTVMQYSYETKEWIIGEYAILNKGFGSDKDLNLNSLVELVGKKQYVEIDGKQLSITEVFSVYVTELVESCKNINPKAEIIGIVLAVPSYLSDDMRADLKSVFVSAGYENVLIELVSDRECLFNSYFYCNEPKKETLLLLDFASRELRAGLYDIEPSDSGAVITSLASIFDRKLGTDAVNHELVEWFTEIYLNNFDMEKIALTKQEKDQLFSFAYQHKDLIFQKDLRNTSMKLYYNFAYPPFQKSVTGDDVYNITLPFEYGMTKFFKDLFQRTLLPEDEISADTVDTVLCTGGGFEMLWARRKVEQRFPNSNIIFYKNSKGIISEGASLVAAKKLGIVDETVILLQDIHKLKYDIGMKVIQNKKERFLPVLEKNTFWWQEREPIYLLLNEATNESVFIDLYRRTDDGNINEIGKIELDCLPSRPAGATRLSVTLQCISKDMLQATIDDMGFGEMFVPSEFSKQYEFVL